MGKHLIDLDYDVLSEARVELGTKKNHRHVQLLRRSSRVYSQRWRSERRPEGPDRGVGLPELHPSHG